MSSAPLHWEGEVDGALFAPAHGGAPLRSAPELMTHLREHAGAYAERELALLGGFALFLCIRDVRIGRAGSVLPAAERRLGEAAPPLADAGQELVFRRGVAQLQDALHPLRNEPHHVLAYLALVMLKRGLAGAETGTG